MTGAASVERSLKVRPAHLALLVLIVAPLFVDLGTVGLVNPDEGRYAEIGREMAVTGDWLVPRLNGTTHWAKPPLSYWCMAVSYHLVGVNETAARLPSAVGGALIVLIVFLLGRSMAGTRAGLLSAVVASSSMLLVVLARTADPNILLSLCTTAAMALYHRSRRPPGQAEGPLPPRGAFRRGSFLLASAFLGLAFVDKGPVGIAVFVTALLAFALLGARRPLVPLRLLPAGILVLLAIGLPWFAVVIARHHPLLRFYLGGEVIDRVVEGKGRTQPPWFFVPVLVGGIMPWTPVWIASVVRAARMRRPADAPRLRTFEDARFLLAWTVGPFLFFSVCSSKLWTYLLPVMPACALQAGCWLASMGGRSGRLARRLLEVSSALPLVVLGGCAIAGSRYFKTPVSTWTIVLVVNGALLALVLAACARRSVAVRAFAVAALAQIVIHSGLRVLAGVEDNLGALASQRWIRDAAAPLGVHGPPIPGGFRPSGERVRLPEDRPRIATFGDFWNSLPFYTFGWKAEWLPQADQRTLYEIREDKDREVRFSADDLAAELRTAKPLYVIAKRNELDTFKKKTGFELPVIASSRNGKFVLLEKR